MVINELLEKHHENYRQKYGRSPLVIRLIPGLFAQFLIEFQVAPENTESCFWNFIPVVRDSSLTTSVELEPVGKEAGDLQTIALELLAKWQRAERKLITNPDDLYALESDIAAYMRQIKE